MGHMAKYQTRNPSRIVVIALQFQEQTSDEKQDQKL